MFVKVWPPFDITAFICLLALAVDLYFHIYEHARDIWIACA